MIINELVTKLSFKQDKGLSNYQKSMMNAQRSTERAAKGMEGAMARSSSAINKMIKFDVQMRTNAAQAKVQALSKMLSGLKNVAAMGLSIAGGVGIGAAAGAGAVGKFAFDAGKEYERLQAALVTATGGEKQANAAYQQIEQFAKKTPYDLTQVADAFIKLKNMGLNPSQEALTAYGNTAGAMGKDLNQMIEAVADATTGEFERLKEFGIKSKSEGDNVTFTFRGVKTTVKKDSKEIENYLMNIGRVQFAGGMARQAATIGGMTSTLGDNFQALGRAIWTGGLGDAAKKFVKWATEMTDKLQPIIEKQLPIFIKDMQKLSIQILPKIQPIVEGITSALFGMGAAYLYIKGIAVADMIMKMVYAWRAMDAAMKVAALSGAIANATVMLIPIAIGAAVAAVAWFGWQVYKYMTGGTDAIQGLRNQFPFLADAVMFVGELIKTWVPIIVNIAKVVGGILSLAFQGFFILVQTGYDKYFKPVFDFMGKLINGIGWAIRSVTTDNQNWINGVNWLKEAFINMYNTVKPYLDALGALTGAIGDNIGRVINSLPGMSGDATQQQGAMEPGSLMGLNKNSKMANDLVKFSHSVTTLKGQCLKAVWQVQQAALKGTSKITAYHAADAAQQMAADKRFKEIKVTKAMLDDPRYRAMLHGAQVFYDRQSGFSPVSGHAESWDMQTKSAHFGRGAVPLKNRSAFNLQHARVFIPVQNTAAAPVANVTVNVGGSNASPKQIGNAAQNGTSKALTKAKQQQRKPTTVQG